jgi:gliding motility-associated lipoprotein GldJ
VFDTLPNGKVLLKRLPGQLDQMPIDEEETFLRQNFTESDNRNYRDGDIESSRKFSNGKSETDGSIPETNSMYNAPVAAKLTKDEDGKIELTIDTKSNRTSLITDEVRVFKGGSWKDRAYWLDPAQRRYLSEYMATNFIGFRCVTDKMVTMNGKSTAKNQTR